MQLKTALPLFLWCAAFRLAGSMSLQPRDASNEDCYPDCDRKLNRADFCEPEFLEAVDRCAFAEYEVSLYMETHLFLVAVPLKPATTTTHTICEDTLLWHDGGEEGRALDVLEDSKAIDKALMLPLKAQVELKDIFKAFMDTDSQVDIHGNHEYDLLERSCAFFVMNMAALLGIPADDRAVSYLTDRLVANGETIKTLRSSPHLDTFLRGRSILQKDGPDRALLELVVRHTVDNPLSCTFAPKTKQPEELPPRPLINKNSSLEENQHPDALLRTVCTDSVRRKLQSEKEDAGKKLQSKKEDAGKKWLHHKMEKQRERLRHSLSHHGRLLFENDEREPFKAMSAAESSKATTRALASQTTCELGVPPLGSLFVFIARFKTTGPGSVVANVFCEDEEGNWFIPKDVDWSGVDVEGNDSETMRCPNAANETLPAGVEWDVSGNHYMLQTVYCEDDLRATIEIKSDEENLESVAIGEVYCWGSLVGITASTPSGDVFTHDEHLDNGDERFLWKFDGMTDSARFSAGCLDIVCPETMPQADVDEIQSDPGLSYLLYFADDETTVVETTCQWWNLSCVLKLLFDFLLSWWA